jgi:hypothetical protein
LGGSNWSPLLSSPLTALLRPFVGHLKGRAVVKAKAERNWFAMQVALTGALIAAPPVRCDPVEKTNPL